MSMMCSIKNRIEHLPIELKQDIDIDRQRE
jgi:hypothetical protein